MTAHAETLFDGSSVIVCRRRHPTITADRPTFALEDVKKGSIASIGTLMDRFANLTRVKYARAPAGNTRRALEQFLNDHAPSAMLIEHGKEAKYFWLSAKRLGLPVFVYFRGFDATGHLKPSRRRSARIRIYREMMKQIDGVFAVSQFLVDELARHGIMHPVTHVIPSGVDTARFVPSHKRQNHVLMAGRLIEKKAPDLSISAFIDAAEMVRDAHLHVVGDGPLRKHCEDLVRQRGAREKVTFHGHLDHSALAGMMAAIPLFIQHSVTSEDNDKEGAPTAIQEAMSCGMAIVSTRHAGIPSLIEDGVTGFLVDEHDKAGFARWIGKMLNNPSKCAEMGRKARQVAQRDYDKMRLHRQLEALLQRYAKQT